MADQKPRAEKWKLWIELTVGLIAVSHAVIAIWNWWGSGPDVTIQKADAITMTYVPSQRLLTVEFGLHVHNGGDGDAIINRVAAYLAVQNDVTSRVIFSEADIEYREPKNVPVNSPILRHSFRTVRVGVTHLIIDPDLDKLFRRKTAEKILVFALYGSKNRSYEVVIPFMFSAQDAEQFFDAKSADSRVRRFL